MQKSYSRTERVAQQIQKEIAVLLQRDIKDRDPRLGLLTVSEVEVSRDLAHAKIFVSSFDPIEKGKLQVGYLNEASPYIRSLIAKVMRMRSVPALKFVLDTSLQEGIRMSKLVDDAIEKDEKKKQDISDNNEQAE